MSDIHGIVKALETTARFLGKDGWATVNPLLVAAMKRRKIIGLGYVMHDGSFYRIRLTEDVIWDA